MSRLPFALADLAKAIDRAADSEDAKVFIGLEKAVFEPVRDELESHRGEPFASRIYFDHGQFRVAMIDPRDFYK